MDKKIINGLSLFVTVNTIKAGDANFAVDADKMILVVDGVSYKHNKIKKEDGIEKTANLYGYFSGKSIKYKKNDEVNYNTDFQLLEGNYKIKKILIDGAENTTLSKKFEEITFEDVSKLIPSGQTITIEIVTPLNLSKVSVTDGKNTKTSENILRLIKDDIKADNLDQLLKLCEKIVNGQKFDSAKGGCLKDVTVADNTLTNAYYIKSCSVKGVGVDLSKGIGDVITAIQGCTDAVVITLGKCFKYNISTVELGGDLAKTNKFDNDKKTAFLSALNGEIGKSKKKLSMKGLQGIISGLSSKTYKDLTIDGREDDVKKNVGEITKIIITQDSTVTKITEPMKFKFVFGVSSEFKIALDKTLPNDEIPFSTDKNDSYGIKLTSETTVKDIKDAVANKLKALNDNKAFDTGKYEIEVFDAKNAKSANDAAKIEDGWSAKVTIKGELKDIVKKLDKDEANVVIEWKVEDEDANYEVATNVKNKNNVTVKKAAKYNEFVDSLAPISDKIKPAIKKIVIKNGKKEWNSSDAASTVEGLNLSPTSGVIIYLDKSNTDVVKSKAKPGDDNVEITVNIKCPEGKEVNGVNDKITFTVKKSELTENKLKELIKNTLTDEKYTLDGTFDTKKVSFEVILTDGSKFMKDKQNTEQPQNPEDNNKDGKEVSGDGSGKKNSQGTSCNSGSGTNENGNEEK